MVITHDNALHCHLKQARYSGNAPPSTHLTYPSKPIFRGDGYYTHVVTLHGYHGTWAGLAAMCLTIIIIMNFYLLSALKIIIIIIIIIPIRHYTK
jgi:hypothetical protein